MAQASSNTAKPVDYAINDAQSIIRLDAFDRGKQIKFTKLPSEFLVLLVYAKGLYKTYLNNSQ